MGSAPQLGQRSDGHIKGPVGLGAQLLSGLQHVPQVVADTNWLGGGRGAAQTAQFAFGIIVAQRGSSAAMRANAASKP